MIFRHFAYLLSTLEPLSKNIDFRLLKRRKVRTAASLNNGRFPKFWNFEKSASKSLHSYMLVLRIAFFLKFCYTSFITEKELSLLTEFSYKILRLTNFPLPAKELYIDFAADAINTVSEVDKKTHRNVWLSERHRIKIDLHIIQRYYMMAGDDSYGRSVGIFHESRNILCKTEPI